MIKLISILRENNILIPRRSPEERKKNHQIVIQKRIQQYMKDGSKGDLDLRDLPITSLPPNLKVGGNLNLTETPIKSLPSGLEVGKSLQLSGTEITSLPNDLIVKKELSLLNTPLSKKITKEQIRKMVPGVKGKIYLLSWDEK
jgi:hypothetical protein